MSFVDEFKTFAFKSNMVDLAIGVIIGAAFGGVVNSLVNDILMPPLGILVGGVDFSQLVIPLKKAVGDQPAVTIQYGKFINTLINFTIIAFTIFVVIKLMNRLRGNKPAEKAPLSKQCPECLSSIPLKAKRCAHCCVQLNAVGHDQKP